MKPFSVFGLGTVLVDHLVQLDAFPERDTKNEAHEHWFQVGGPVPTALAAVTRLGGGAAFQGKWSADHLGQMIEQDLRDWRIDFDPPTCESDSQTGFAHVWVENASGRRTSVFHRGSHSISIEEVDEAKVSRHDALHLDGWSTAAAVRAAKAMRAGGGRVFLDLGSPKDDLDNLLACVDVVNCPRRLFEQLHGDGDPVSGAQRLLQKGPEQVTVTDGAQGAWLVTRHDSLRQSAFQVEAVDTNGAGDTFSGAIIFASMQGWPVDRQLAFASAAAALKCGQPGNREALPTYEEVTEYLDRHGDD